MVVARELGQDNHHRHPDRGGPAHRGSPPVVVRDRGVLAARRSPRPRSGRSFMIGDRHFLSRPGPNGPPALSSAPCRWPWGMIFRPARYPLGAVQVHHWLPAGA
jgi:hypothetical protein